MNISDSIHFDGVNLFAGQTSKIIYNGFLAQDEPEEIYMHYGYGYNWENLQELKLVKGPSGYEGDITFIRADELNFCFRSQNGKWDNNNRQNFIATIDPAPILRGPKINYLDSEIPTLKKIYYLKKKIKLTFYKLFSGISKLFSGKLKT